MRGRVGAKLVAVSPVTSMRFTMERTREGAGWFLGPVVHPR